MVDSMTIYGWIVIATIGWLVAVALIVIFFAGASICNEEFDRSFEEYLKEKCNKK
jgi:uncharacterized membrane protein